MNLLGSGLILPQGGGDTIAPTVANVTSSKANGTYYTSDTIGIQVVFSEPVIVTGTPRIQLRTGAGTTQVNYVSGSGTDTLLFNYTPSVGHYSNDLDYEDTNSLGLNGGTIQDAAGNNATLTLASPGAAGSLGANKAIVIFGNSTSYLLDGSSSYAGPGYIAAIDALLGGGNPFTLAYWGKKVRTGATQTHLAHYGYDPTPEYGLLLRILSDESFAMDYGAALNGGIKAIVIRSTTTIDTGWHLFIVTYDGSRTAAGLLAYLDNALMNRSIVTDTWVSGGGGDVPSVAAGLIIGKLNVHDVQYHGGYLNQFMLFNRVLSSGERSTLYNSGTPTAPPRSGLILYPPMTTGDTYPTMTDRGGAGYNLTANGGAGASDFAAVVPP